MNYLMQWQAKHGLSADGVIGKNTAAKMMEFLGMTNNLQFCHLIGQMAHESGNFTHSRENLNYSADRLIATWPKRFNKSNAWQYHRQPEKIANKVYANRLGNGNEASGDGWKYRGLGAIQLTGKDNIEAFLLSDNLPLSTNLDTIFSNPDLYFKSGYFFFDYNGIFPLCKDTTDAAIKNVTRRVNGGTIGLDDRIKKTKAMFRALGQ